MALIEVVNLKKTYTEKSEIETQALRGIDLNIQEGDFVAIAGPSGSGKTTLLNLLGALDKPSTGSITFDGINISEMPITQLADFRLKKIGFVFQAFNLFNTLSAIENVEFILLLQGTPAGERKAKALELLQSVGLAEFSHKRPSQLSAGQQQRVAVVRALASNPKVILADEPTANLDSATAASLLELMRELNRSRKITFVFSTHDKMIMERADKVFLLKDGRIVP